MLSAVNSCWRRKSSEPSRCNWRRPSSVFGRGFQQGSMEMLQKIENLEQRLQDMLQEHQKIQKKSQCFERCMCEKTMEKRWPREIAKSKSPIEARHNDNDDAPIRIQEEIRAGRSWRWISERCVASVKEDVEVWPVSPCKTQSSAPSCTDLASRAEALFELGAEQQARWQELHEWLRGSWRMCAVGVPMGNADAAYASACNTIWTWCTSEGSTKKGGGVCSWSICFNFCG